jgi:hypothetical protein
LRQADEQLFMVLGGRDRRAASSRRLRRGPVVLALIAMVPLAGALWAAATDRSRPVERSVRVEVTPMPAMIVTSPINRSTPFEHRAAEHHPPTLRVAERKPRAAFAPLAHSRRVSWVAPRAHVPRPLSPGEFGR